MNKIKTEKVFDFPNIVMNIANNNSIIFLFGRYSPNKEFFIAWNNSHCCAINLTNYSHYLYTGGIDINNAWIANNGNYLIEDWLHNNILSGQIVYGRLNNYFLMKRVFTANIFDTELTSDGEWFSVQLCRSNSEDSHKRYSFNMKTLKWSSIRRKI